MAARDDDTDLGGGTPRGRYAAARVLDADEVQGVLSGAFYAPDAKPGPAGRARKGEQPKPVHYKVICISLYTKDLERLDKLVEELKARGVTKANRSALIRVALDQLDLDKVPKGL